MTESTSHSPLRDATALTSLGIEPPDLDVWSHGVPQGRISEDPAPASPA